ncbi:MAG: hypothetical protein EOL87_08775 [Spartobacteria bacterium]|nr:hypothetical protein [Spartobacteria bacterium]
MPSQDRSVMERYIAFIQHHRRRLCIVLIILAVLSGGLTATLRIESDWLRLFPYSEGMETLQALSRAGADTELTFHLSTITGEPISQRAGDVHDMAEIIRSTGLFSLARAGDELESLDRFSPGITLFLGTEGSNILLERLQPDGMKSAVDQLMDMMFSPAAGLARTFLQHDPLQVGALAAEQLCRVSGYTLDGGMIQSTNGRYAVIIALPPVKTDDAWLTELARWIPRFKQDTAQKGLECRMAGGSFLQAELRSLIKHDLTWTSAVALGLVCLFLFAVYRRRPLAALCVVVPQLIGLTVTFALIRCFSREIDLITSMASAMLMGLGVDFGIHMLARYDNEQGIPAERMHNTLRGVGKGVVAGALTTAIAFFAIFVTGMQSLYLLGFTAGVGILISVLAYFSVFPLLVFLWIPSENTSRRKGFHQENMRRWNWLPRLAVPLLILLMVLLPLALPRSAFSTDMTSMQLEKSLIYKDMLELDTRLPGGSGDQLLIETTTRGMTADMDWATAVQRLFPSIYWQTPFSSIPDAAELSANRARILDTLQKNGLTPSNMTQSLQDCYETAGLIYPKELDDYLAGLLHAYDDKTVWERFYQKLPFSRGFYLDNGQRWVMVGNAQDWKPVDIEHIEQTAKHHGRAVKSMSLGMLMQSLRGRVIRESLASAAVSIVAILLLLKLFFRRWRLVLPTFIPLTVGLLLTVVIMGLMHSPFNFFNLTVLPLIFGLGIDDGIHFMRAYDESSDIFKALRSTAKPIVLTTCTTCIGFGSLMLASFQGIVSMGQLVVTGMLACMISVLTVLPFVVMHMPSCKKKEHHDSTNP